MAMFAAGQKLTAAALNAALPIHIGVTASSFSLASNASTYFAVSFNAQSASNTTGMWSSGTPTKIFAPTAGTYSVGGFVVWPGGLSTTDGRGTFRLNGSGVDVTTAKVATQRGSTGNQTAVASGTVIMQAGDYVEMYLNQNSGSALSLIVALNISRLSTSTS